MKKLEVGDYVKNLTKDQWDKLLTIENGSFQLSYIENDTDTGIFYKHSLVYEDDALSHGAIDFCKTELTYRQFLGRAKMTFNVARMTQK